MRIPDRSWLSYCLLAISVLESQHLRLSPGVHHDPGRVHGVRSRHLVRCSRERRVAVVARVLSAAGLRGFGAHVHCIVVLPDPRAAVEDENRKPVLRPIAAARDARQSHHRRHGLRLRLRDFGRHRWEHMGIHRIRHALDRAGEDRDLTGNVAVLSHHDLPAVDRGMARTEGSATGPQRGRFFSADMGSARGIEGRSAGAMKFLVAGLNHRTAPVEVRERLAFNEAKLASALDDLKRRPGLLEGMILSTCNRVEIAVTTDEQTDAEQFVEQFLADTQNVERDWVSQYLYHHQGHEAIRHLFRVASSLDSMVIGEPQILGQLKAAYGAAKERGAVSGFLEMVLSRAFNVAKRVRSETDIGQSAVSISYAAVELAREIFGNLSDRKVLLIGAGKMSELSARHLRRSGVGQIFVTNRTQSRAQEMAKLFNGRILEYDRFASSLHEMDIVIASSGAPNYILHKDQMRKAIEARRNRPMFLIDIAVPRNIEPSINEIDNVFLYDIDDLQQVVNKNVKGRLKVAEQVEEIIAEEVERTVSRLKEREIAPMIVSLQEQLEQVRLAEIERMRGRLGSLTPQQEEAVQALTRGIINKIAHGPISELRKQAAQPDGHHFASVIRRVFRLGASS